MKKFIIGVDLGGTKISTAAALPNGRILAIDTIPTLAHLGAKKVIDRIASSVIYICKKANIGLSDVQCIGIGAPGPVDALKGTVLNPPNLKGWKKVYLRDILSKRLKKKVVLENDANCAAIAELKFGAGKKFSDFVYATISTGIGGGIVIGGKLYRGNTGSAGEIGHSVIDINGPKCSCGLPGHLEGMAAGPAIAKRSGISPEQLNALAKKGNKKALKEIRFTGELIGIGFSNVVNIVNPEAIIVGGGISNFGKPLFDSIKKTVKIRALAPVKIVPAKLKKDVGVIGAVAICL